MPPKTKEKTNIMVSKFLSRRLFDLEQQNKKELVCCICLEECCCKHCASYLICGHGPYHLQCILSMTNLACPVCRS